MCEINDSGAGDHAGVFRCAAERFCQQHPEERFMICGAVGKGGLQITIQRKGDQHAGWPRSVPIGPGMEDAILANLENWWSGQT